MQDLPVSFGFGAHNRFSVRKYGWVFASAVLGASSLNAVPAFAHDTTRQLIEIMNANGSITQAQYNQLKTASRQSVQGGQQQASHSQISTQHSDEAFREEVNARLARFDWVSKVQLKGDLRLRYEHDDSSARENAQGHNINRDRGRLRYRLGVITTPTDALEVGAGIASGSDDPRSTNQTFGDDFSSKGIRLDYAYAAYQVTDSLRAIGGKFETGDYLWAPTDLLWDGDVNPEGISAHYEFEESRGSTFVNSGLWVLQEFSGNSSDPYLYYVQAGQHIEAGNLFAALAGTYYGYENTAQPGTFDPAYSAGTNTTDQFSVVDINGQLGTGFPRGQASLIGEYVRNMNSDVPEDSGYAFGGRVGVDEWSLKYLYGDLDANAVPDVFPDSDRQGGATDMKGHEVAVSYALNDAVELGLDYYNTERKSINRDDQLLQADVVFKF